MTTFGTFVPSQTAVPLFDYSTERYLFEFSNGWAVSVVQINEQIRSEMPASYGEIPAGTWEAALMSPGSSYSLVALAELTGIPMEDPLGGNGVYNGDVDAIVDVLTRMAAIAPPAVEGAQEAS